MDEHHVSCPIIAAALSYVPQNNEAYARKGNWRAQAALYGLQATRPDAKCGYAALDKQQRSAPAEVKGAHAVKDLPAGGTSRPL
jgi:hypothetical protein